MKNRKVNKINRVIASWETLAPASTFGGMTLAEFKTRVQPTTDLQDKLLSLVSESTDTEKRLETSTEDSNAAALLVVNAVKGDPDHGEDSPLYASMGYVRKSDRRSGLSRKAQPANVVPLKAAA